MRALAVELGAPVQGLSDPGDVEAALGQELERRGEPHLWVVDDVPDGLDSEELRAWFAPHRLAKTLLTTRSRRYGAIAAALEPGVLSVQEAGELLARHRPPINAGEAEAAKLLADELGFHALALEVAGAALAMAAGPAPYADFRAALAEPDDDELEFAAQITGALPTGHQTSIAETLLSSVASLSDEATDLLRIASLLANTPIPTTVIDSVLAEADGLVRSKRRLRPPLQFPRILRRDGLDQHEARHRGLRARGDAVLRLHSPNSPPAAKR